MQKLNSLDDDKTPVACRVHQIKLMTRNERLIVAVDRTHENVAEWETNEYVHEAVAEKTKNMTLS